MEAIPLRLAKKTPRTVQLDFRFKHLNYTLIAGSIDEVISVRNLVMRARRARRAPNFLRQKASFLGIHASPTNPIIVSPSLVSEYFNEIESDPSLQHLAAYFALMFFSGVFSKDSLVRIAEAYQKADLETTKTFQGIDLWTIRGAVPQNVAISPNLRKWLEAYPPPLNSFKWEELVHFGSKLSRRFGLPMGAVRSSFSCYWEQLAQNNRRGEGQQGSPYLSEFIHPLPEDFIDEFFRVLPR